jgi:cell division initiation protein
MIDLTPLDVRKKRGDFRRILRGYDPEEVDSFLELVGERMEELVKENLLLSDRGERLERSLTALEQRENAVQEALVTAQKLRTEVQEQSRRDAAILKDQALREVQLLRAEADAEVARRLGEVNGLIQERRRALEDMERNRRKFLKSFRGLLERELDTIEVEEARAPLEEIPLELEFRGWIPDDRRVEEGQGAGDEADAEGAEDVLEVSWGGVAGEPEGEDAEVATEQGDSLEPPEASSAEVPLEQGAEEVAALPHEDLRRASPQVPEVEPGAAPAAGRSTEGDQPEWLFSLLKRESQGGRDEDEDEDA